MKSRDWSILKKHSFSSVGHFLPTAAESLIWTLVNSVPPTSPPPLCSYRSDNRRVWWLSVIADKMPFVSLICQWSRPRKTSFGSASKRRIRGHGASSQDQRTRTIFRGVWIPFPPQPSIWSGKSGERSLRMAASACWSGIGTLNGTNESWLDRTGQWPAALSLPVRLH